MIKAKSLFASLRVFMARFDFVTERPQFFDEFRVWSQKSKLRLVFFEFVLFGLKQGWAALFGGLLLGAILVSRYWFPFSSFMHRYDFLFIYAVSIQAALIFFKLETLQEAKVILLFHIVGTAMELFKTAVGSWTYPETAIFRIEGVPLFTGFMYAAVGSYLARVWRAFDFQFTNYPPIWQTSLLSLFIYVNFFAHHYLPDIRILLFGVLGILYFKTRVYFRVDERHYWMPLLLGFFLVSVFIWFGEQIGTFAKAWRYPNQVDGWQLVSIGKLGSWYLLMIISFVMVTWLHPIERRFMQNDRGDDL